MNWRDVIIIGEQPVELVPRAGMLVEDLRSPDPGSWLMLRNQWSLDEIGVDCRPILPAVTPGCGYTRFDVLDWLMPGEYPTLALGGGHHAQWQDGIGLTLCVDGSVQRPAYLPALKLAIQRYEALLAWWEANGGEW